MVMGPIETYSMFAYTEQGVHLTFAKSMASLRCVEPKLSYWTEIKGEFLLTRGKVLGEKGQYQCVHTDKWKKLLRSSQKVAFHHFAVMSIKKTGQRQPESLKQWSIAILCLQTTWNKAAWIWQCFPCPVCLTGMSVQRHESYIILLAAISARIILAGRLWRGGSDPCADWIWMPRGLLARGKEAEYQRSRWRRKTKVQG